MIKNPCNEVPLSAPEPCKLPYPKTQLDYTREGIAFAILDLLRNDMYDAAKFLAISWNLKDRHLDLKGDDALMFDLFLKTL
jgi:hypothetical protein